MKFFIWNHLSCDYIPCLFFTGKKYFIKIYAYEFYSNQYMKVFSWMMDERSKTDFDFLQHKLSICKIAWEYKKINSWLMNIGWIFDQKGLSWGHYRGKLMAWKCESKRGKTYFWEKYFSGFFINYLKWNLYCMIYSRLWKIFKI